jgi:hypothetical protein
LSSSFNIFFYIFSISSPIGPAIIISHKLFFYFFICLKVCFTTMS